MSIKFTLVNRTHHELLALLDKAKFTGDLSTVKRVMAILSLAEGKSVNTIASVLRVSVESIRIWFKAFMLKGVWCSSFRATRLALHQAKVAPTFVNSFAIIIS